MVMVGREVTHLFHSIFGGAGKYDLIYMTMQPYSFCFLYLRCVLSDKRFLGGHDNLRFQEILHLAGRVAADKRC